MRLGRRSAHETSCNCCSLGARVITFHTRTEYNRNLATEGPKTKPSSGKRKPASLDFGDQVLQTISKQLKVTLTNNTDGPIKISGVDTSDADGQDFVVDYDDDECTDETIEPGKSCSIGVVFFPLMAGERKSFLLITYGDPDNPQKISLKGNGIKPTS